MLHSRYRSLGSAFVFLMICCLMSFSTAMCELEIVSEEDGIVYNSNRDIIGITQQYLKNRSLHEHSSASISYPQLSIVNGVAYDQSNQVRGITEDCVLDQLDYFTTFEDHFYHIDASCDNGHKSPITLEGALLFNKLACPKCVNPILLSFCGENTLIWKYSFQPWEAMEKWSAEDAAQIIASVPEKYKEQSNETVQVLESRCKSLIPGSAVSPVQDEILPDSYVRHFKNISGGYTVVMKAPSPKDIAYFAEQFGIGIWIIAEKFSLKELTRARINGQAQISQYIQEHPELDIMLESVEIDDENNVVRIKISGNDSIALKQVDLPLCIRLVF